MSCQLLAISLLNVLINRFRPFRACLPFVPLHRALPHANALALSGLCGYKIIYACFFHHLPATCKAEGLGALAWGNAL